MQFTETMEYRRLQCTQCGVVYFFPEKWCVNAAEKKTGWECPNGHGQMFRDSERDQLRRERDRLKQRLAQKDDEINWQRDRREAAEHTARAYKGHVTRIKRRVGKGSCPCCKRHFTNLEKHMASKHPEYHAEEPDLKVVEGGKR